VRSAPHPIPPPEYKGEGTRNVSELKRDLYAKNSSHHRSRQRRRPGLCNSSGQGRLERRARRSAGGRAARDGLAHRRPVPRDGQRLRHRRSRGRHEVGALVHAAGTNIPKRSWETLTIEDYRQVIDTNLNGAFYCVRSLLPAMRKKGGGTIVFIVSDAGIIANAKAGAAYVASKFAERGLAQSINAEERGNGIRACAISPGDINTPILEKRPVPPPAEAREIMLQPEDVAECVMLAINLPSRAVVEELVIRPMGPRQRNP
jgi:NAD(P)-dependent dehydrogenase (short-subunit alcohol dehydrogenase family)